MSEQDSVDWMVERFAAWLREARRQAVELGLDDQPPAGSEREREIGLVDLAGELTALRHEIKLGTRSGRAATEQMASAVESLRRAVESITAAAAVLNQVGNTDRELGLALSLVDLDEALERAGGELAAVRRQFAGELEEELVAAFESALTGGSWLSKLWGSARERRAVAAVRAVAARQVQRLDSLFEGYSMIHKRLKRGLAAAGITPIECLGRAVDPELMAVLEAVDEPGQPPGHVLAELRRGYLWNGRVLRYAEVRAARSPADGEPGPADSNGPVILPAQLG